MKAPDTQEETPFGALPPHFSGCHVKKRGQIPLADRTKAPTLQPQPDSSQIQPSGPLGVRPRHSGTERNCSLLVLPEGPTQNGEQKSQILASATTQGCPQLPTIELPVNAGARGGGGVAREPGSHGGHREEVQHPPDLVSQKPQAGREGAEPAGPFMETRRGLGIPATQGKFQGEKGRRGGEALTLPQLAARPWASYLTSLNLIFFM